MKKPAFILLISIYALATMGFGLQQFYCCGKLKSVTISLSQDAWQKYKNGKEKKGCCDNKYHFFKVKDHHITADQISGPVNSFVHLYLYTPLFNGITFASEKTLISYSSNAPPLHAGVPLYIYNCVFRI
jgi:hypothetical protein